MPAFRMMMSSARCVPSAGYAQYIAALTTAPNAPPNPGRLSPEFVPTILRAVPYGGGPPDVKQS